jgi:5-oxopent-3-ene-1,2,5-tricarboxylate decarboxylase/2-hydroxyhepta-2,4-diene-1,7-dioate isomerase
MIAGAVYGVVLNDQAQIAALGEQLREPPYGRPPVAPVMYIKPRTCIRTFGAATPVAAELGELEAAATLGLLFDDRGGIGAACLALDVSEPHASYYRPAIRQRCRDGFLPLGAATAFSEAMASTEILTRVNGRIAHRWSLDRLVRDIPTLIADIGSFMTFQPGDLLLAGLAGDAPKVRVGDRVEVEAAGLPTLKARFEPEKIP